MLQGFTNKIHLHNGTKKKHMQNSSEKFLWYPTEDQHINIIVRYYTVLVTKMKGDYIMIPLVILTSVTDLKTRTFSLPLGGAIQRKCRIAYNK